jgi:AcrR family transcriptional regulator
LLRRRHTHDMARVPNAERSLTTRTRLMEATVECLSELGWSGMTTTVVAERAGVSRGAQLHHYPTKAALVVAAIEHLATLRRDEMRRSAETLPSGANRTAAVLELLAAHHTGPLFTAALEVWVAARTDPALREALVPVEAKVGREVHRLTVEMLGVDEGRPGARESVQATLDLMRGLGVANQLTDDSARRQRLLRQWAQTLDAALQDATLEANRG